MLFCQKQWLVAEGMGNKKCPKMMSWSHTHTPLTHTRPYKKHKLLFLSFSLFQSPLMCLPALGYSCYNPFIIIHFRHCLMFSAYTPTHPSPILHHSNWLIYWWVCSVYPHFSICTISVRAILATTTNLVYSAINVDEPPFSLNLPMGQKNLPLYKITAY